MTTKKPEPQAEYDFRHGVRGKHSRVLINPGSVKGLAGEAAAKSPGKAGERAPKPVKR